MNPFNFNSFNLCPSPFNPSTLQPITLQRFNSSNLCPHTFRLSPFPTCPLSHLQSLCLRGSVAQKLHHFFTISSPNSGPRDENSQQNQSFSKIDLRFGEILRGSARVSPQRRASSLDASFHPSLCNFHLAIFNFQSPSALCASTLQRFNGSTLQPFNAPKADSTLQRFNGSTVQRFNDSTQFPYEP